MVSKRVVKLLNLPNVTGYLVVGLLAALGCVLVDHLSGNNVLTEENHYVPTKETDVWT